MKKVISKMPASVPLLATTATANDRVIADLEEQLGGDAFVSRGPLMRNNLSIQVLKLANKTERYAWIYENVPKLEGSGIIYCLTQADCDELAEFLTDNGISARSYHAGRKDTEETERLFMNNDIKVIVATTKLGMGYDKGDIAFVIHYQTPSSIVAYYQQIGRAGRNIERAYTFLMNGKEDEDILEYFRMTAFPTEWEASSIYGCIKDNSDARLYTILGKLNISKKRVDNALNFLINEELIYKNKSKYNPTTTAFHYNGEHYAEIIKRREEDYAQMKELMDTDQCYNRFIVNALDDTTNENCGLCANCLNKAVAAEVSGAAVEAAAEFLEKQYYPI